MPYLKLNTNITLTDEQTLQLMRQLSQLLARETGKPERYVMVQLEANKTMLFADSSDTMAFLQCKSIGLTSTQAKSLASSLCRLLQNTVCIPPDRVYIEFGNCAADYWGWNNSTFG